MPLIHFFESDAGVLSPVTCGIGGMRHHHEGQARDAACDRDAGLPSTALPLLVDGRQLVVRIEVGAAESGKVLAAAEHAAVAQAAQKCARVGDGFLRRLARQCANPARSSTLRIARSNTGAKSVLKPSARTSSPIRRPCRRKSFFDPAAATSAHRRDGRDDVAQAIDRAALHVDAEKHRRGRWSSARR